MVRRTISACRIPCLCYHYIVQRNTPQPLLIKKYSNRRLYDTVARCYITLDQVAEMIRLGQEVRVVDASSEADLTQSTLAQIILESRGAARLLPVPLLVRLVRLGEDGLVEFFGRFMSSALDLYLQMRQGAKMVSPYSSFFGFPFGNPMGLGGFAGDEPRAAAADEPGPPSATASEVADLRRELEELRQAVKKRAKPRRQPR